MSQKNQLIEVITLAQDQQRMVCASLDEPERQKTGSLEHWSAKDHICHSAFWVQKLADNLAAFQRGEARQRTNDVDQANAEVFSAHQHDSWQDILRQAQEAFSDILAQIEMLSQADLEGAHVLPWQNRPLWRTIAGTAVLHPIIHLASLQIERGNPTAVLEMYSALMPALNLLSDDAAWQGTLRYDQACALALVGETGQALAALKDALALDPTLREWAMQDSDLASLHGDPDFKALGKPTPGREAAG